MTFGETSENAALIKQSNPVLFSCHGSIEGDCGLALEKVYLLAIQFCRSSPVVYRSFLSDVGTTCL